MDEIIYEEEPVREEVFEGTLILDGHMTPEAQRQRIFDMMRIAGVPIHSEDQYDIGYDGAEDDYGISETQSARFVVFRNYVKEVPYKVTREEIYTGTYILDSLRRTPEEQREFIFNMMEDDGVQVGDKDTLEIGYDGAEDDNGISETQSTRFSVYRVTKTRIMSEEEQKVALDEIHDELAHLRDALQNSTHSDEISNISQRIAELTARMDLIMQSSAREYDALEIVLAECEKEIERVEAALDENRRIYQESFERIQEIMRRHTEIIASPESVSLEEYERIENEISNQLMKENDSLLSIKKAIDQHLAELEQLKKKRAKVRKDIDTAKALGLSANEYLEVTSQTRKKKIMDAILEAKGLADIVSIPAKERTPEQRRILKEARAEIRKELYEAKRENEDKSVLDLVEALYGIETQVQVRGKQRVLIVKPESLDNIRKNAARLPEKVIQPTDKPIDYVPHEAPSDMSHMLDAEKQREAVDEIVPEEKMESHDSEVRAIEKKIIYVDVDHDRKHYVDDSVLQLFGFDYSHETPIQIDNKNYYEVDLDVADYIVSRLEPGIVEIRETHLVLEDEVQRDEPVEEERRGLTDRYTVYHDTERGKYYVRKPVLPRFGIEQSDHFVRIDGVPYYAISEEQVEAMQRNADNELSPYLVEVRDVKLREREEESVEKPGEALIPVPPKSEALMVVPPIGPEIPTSFDGSDDVPFAEDEDDDKKEPPAPVSEPVAVDEDGGDDDVDDEPPVPPVAEEEDDDKKTPIPISDDDDDEDESDEPSDEDEDEDEDEDDKDKPVPIEGDDGSDGTTPGDDDDDTKKPEDVEIITLYRDLNDNNQVYAPEEVLHRFGITSPTAGEMINGVKCFKIHKDTDQIINSIARMSHSPKMEVRYIDVRLKKKVRPHVEQILDKITTGLDIRSYDASQCKARNLKIVKQFKQELSSGTVAYNIVHVVPAILKAGVNFFRKLSAQILTTERGRKSMDELKKRLDALSEEELEVLFEEYKGSQLKTDMNNQINPLILDRLREYGLEKVAKLNEEVKENYAKLFTLLGQIKALEEKIAKGKSTSETIKAMNAQRKALLEQASQCIQVIMDRRKLADNLLSSGVHGIEEDFKAVATKLSYVGMRFAKSHHFDNELQHKLGVYGRELSEAIANGNAEEVVHNFMGLESCYYDNTSIRGSLVGRRSVGSKYYSPIAEQFDYRDDPFIRDLLSTIAITSATVSVINAVRVHQIEQGRILSDNQAQANTVNAQNDATMQYVHDTGTAITGKRGTFREGMEAQAHQDVLTNAGTRERAHLDSTNWTFNNAYHTADHAGHAAYNQFNADVTTQISDVASQYARGAITQAEALTKMAQISSSAQQGLRDVVDNSLTILKGYAATHPQFDLTAFQESMEYILAHPDAIANMNQAAVDVTNLAEGLSSLQAAHMTALTSLPSDMASTIVAAASSVLLARNVCQSMQDKTTKKNRYGNEVTEMMEEYLFGKPAEEESRHK